MNSLKDYEWVLINNMLIELYATKDVKKIIQLTYKYIANLLKADMAFLLVYDDNGNIDLERSEFSNMDDDIKKVYCEKYFELDYVRFVLNTNKSVVFRDTDIIENSLRCKTPFYREFLQPNRMEYGCGFIVEKNNKVLGSMNLFRGHMLGDFSQNEVFILSIIEKHLSNILYDIKYHSLAVVNLFLDEHEEIFLTAREKEVLELIVVGYSNQEISEKLVISLSTTKKHLNNIFKKFDVKNRLQLLVLIHNLG